MATVDVSLSVRGLRENIRAIEDMEKRLGNLEPAWTVAAQLMIRFIDDRFATGTDPSGNPWEPLSDATLLSRRGSTATILVDTGRLRNSITAFHDGNTLKFGTNVVYAAVHQLGGEHIPERPFFPVADVGGSWVFIDDGPSAALLEQIGRGVESYVATGRVKV